LSKSAAPALRPSGDLGDLTTSLQAVQHFNVHYLEFDLMDAAGKLVASSEEIPSRPSPDRIATAFNLDGTHIGDGVNTASRVQAAGGRLVVRAGRRGIRPVHPRKRPIP
jgi:hypothetical protein